MLYVCFLTILFLIVTVVSSRIPQEVRGGSSIFPQEGSPASPTRQYQRRATSSLIVDLIDQQLSYDLNGGDDDDQSSEIRDLIVDRTRSTMEDLQREVDDDHHSSNEARKLLHYLAPKIPAIRHSPDVSLRIQASRRDPDCGWAACVLASVTRVWSVKARRRHKYKLDASTTHAQEIVKDRRWEQLVECVRCGVELDLEYVRQLRINTKDSASSTEPSASTSQDDSVSLEERYGGRGLSIRDSCRAAWGIAVLASSTATAMTSETRDLLHALAIRVTEMLRYRQQLLQSGDILGVGDSFQDSIDRFSCDLAQDAAVAIWTFACVRACTGADCSQSLVDLTASILVQDPYQLRRVAQELQEPDKSLGSNDAVRRLEDAEQHDQQENDDQDDEQTSEPTHSSNSTISTPNVVTLLDRLSLEELTDIVWGMALHVRPENSTSAAIKSVCARAFSTLIAHLRDEVQPQEEAQESHGAEGDDDLDAENTEGENGRETTATHRGNEEHYYVPGNDNETEEMQHDDNEEVDPDTLLDTSLSQEQNEEVSMELVDGAEILAAESLAADKNEESIKLVDAAEILAAENLAAERNEDSVELVDAAEILAAENLAAERNEETVELVDAAEVVAAESASADRHEESVELVDAAEVVVAESASADRHEESVEVVDAVEVLTDGQVIEAVETVVGSDALASESPSTEDPVKEPEGSESKRTQREHEHLSPQDLCTLAWAATELDVTHRETLVKLVCDIFKDKGPSCFQESSPRELSNMCWAIARNRAAVNISSADPIIKVMADRALALIDHLEEPDVSTTMLVHWSAQEISRFVWSLSTILNNRGSVRWTSVSIVSFIHRSLEAAASNLEIFGSEDMARIIWAFLSLTDTSESFAWPSIAQTIGKLLSVIEMSLLQWESGELSLSASLESKEQKEVSRLVSFIGRSLFAKRFLDQQIEESHHSSDVSRISGGKGKLPLIRDLPVDPLTLCKLSSSLYKLKNHYDGFLIENSALTRLPPRLFTSHNGRLMRGCPSPDLVRLVEAVALSAEEPANREQTGQFARKLASFVNEMAVDDEGFIDLELSAAEYSALLWSFGKLGIKFSNLGDPSSAHRRLQIVPKLRFVVSGLDSLSISKLIRLFAGTISTQLVLHLGEEVVALARHIEGMIPKIRKESDVCVLMEALGSLRKLLLRRHVSMQGQTNDDTNATKTRENDGKDETSPWGSPAVSKGQEDSREICEHLLSALTMHVVNLVPTIGTSGLRWLMSTLIQIPYQSDGLVDAIEACLKDRTADLEIERQIVQTVEDATSSLSSLEHYLNELGEEVPPARDEEGEETERAMDREAVLSLIGATRSNLQEIQRVLGYSQPYATKRPCFETSALVLSWCRLQIEQYRRIDFESGRMSNRLDQTQRRDMAKRALSRLLPDTTG